MAVPKFESFFLPTLKVLSVEAELNTQGVVDYISIEMELSDADMEELTRGGSTTKVRSRVSWSLQRLEHAGLTERSKRGVYRLTQEGLALLQTKPSRIDLELLRTYPKFQEWEGRSAKKTGRPAPEPVPSLFVEAPESQIQKAYAKMAKAYDEWRNIFEQDLLNRVRRASPKSFEQTVLNLLIKMGYGGGDPARGEVTGRSGDGGIDGVIWQDALRLDKMYFQAKRYAEGSKVSSPKMREFVGTLVLEGATKGVFVTTSDFTPNAQKAAGSGPNHIVLLNGEELAHLMVLHDVGVREGAVYNLKRIDTDYFEPDREADFPD